jgi:hypothetical protein
VKVGGGVELGTGVEVGEGIEVGVEVGWDTGVCEGGGVEVGDGVEVSIWGWNGADWHATRSAVTTRTTQRHRWHLFNWYLLCVGMLAYRT